MNEAASLVDEDDDAPEDGVEGEDNGGIHDGPGHEHHPGSRKPVGGDEEDEESKELRKCRPPAVTNTSSPNSSMMMPLLIPLVTLSGVRIFIYTCRYH